MRCFNVNVNINIIYLCFLSLFMYIVSSLYFYKNKDIQPNKYHHLYIYEVETDKMLELIGTSKIFIVRNFTDEFSYITPNYLRQNYGNQMINAHTTICEQYSKNIVQMTLTKFFKKYNKESLYIKEDVDFMYKTNLRKRVDMKMRNYFTNLFLRYYLIWIGSKGTKTGIHKDMDEQNYLLQVYGKKKVILFKSDDDTIFKVRKEKEGTASLSSVDYWNNELDIPKKEVILHAGDILSIPAGWWHCAENLSESIAISCRAESCLNILSYFIS